MFVPVWAVLFLIFANAIALGMIGGLLHFINKEIFDHGRA